MAKQTNTPEVEKKEFTFVFTKINYIIMLVGIVLLAVGYLLLCGGGSDDPICSTWRCSTHAASMCRPSSSSWALSLR